MPNVFSTLNFCTFVINFSLRRKTFYLPFPGSYVMGDFGVRCVNCNELQSPYALSCAKDNALVRACYHAKRLEPKSFHGMWTFFDWLPVNGIIKEVGEGAITYKST